MRSISGSVTKEMIGATLTLTGLPASVSMRMLRRRRAGLVFRRHRPEQVDGALDQRGLGDHPDRVDAFVVLL